MSSPIQRELTLAGSILSEPRKPPTEEERAAARERLLGWVREAANRDDPFYQLLCQEIAGLANQSPERREILLAAIKLPAGGRVKWTRAHYIQLIMEYRAARERLHLSRELALDMLSRRRGISAKAVERRLTEARKGTVKKSRSSGVTE